MPSAMMTGVPVLSSIVDLRDIAPTEPVLVVLPAYLAAGCLFITDYAQRQSHGGSLARSLQQVLGGVGLAALGLPGSHLILDGLQEGLRIILRIHTLTGDLQNQLTHERLWSSSTPGADGLGRKMDGSL